MNTESELLLALSRLALDEDQLQHCRSLIETHGADIDWGGFVDQAARHRTIPLVGWHATQHRLFHAKPNGPEIPYPWLYQSAYHCNRERNKDLAEEFGTVLRALNEGGIAYAIRKGPVVGERLYRNPGLRRMNDLDILVERARLQDVGAIMKSLGYIQGRVSENGDAIEEFSRHTRVYWRMHLNNDLPYRKLSQSEHVESYVIDICLDIFQPLSDSSVAVSDLLDRRIETVICGETGFSLSLEDQFIDLCSHLHKEATALFYIEFGCDLELLKFLDIALSCAELTDQDRWPSVIERIRACKAERSVYYALHHTALVYPEYVPATVLDALRPEDRTYLDEFGTFDGKPQRWHVPFLARLFENGRMRHVTDRTSVPRL